MNKFIRFEVLTKSQYATLVQWGFKVRFLTHLADGQNLYEVSANRASSAKEAIK